MTTLATLKFKPATALAHLKTLSSFFDFASNLGPTVRIRVAGMPGACEA